MTALIQTGWNGTMPGESAENSSARSAIILVLVLFAIAMFVIFRGLQTVAWMEAKMWGHANPWLLDVPQPLPRAQPQSSPSNSKAQQIKSFDYEFSVPWGEPTANPRLNYVQFRFKPGQAVVFYDPGAQLDTVALLRSSTAPEYQNFPKIEGSNPITTNYALYQAVYEASPAQASLFASTDDTLRLHLLLLLKLGLGFDAKPPIYSFADGGIRGFQFGDPANGGPVAIRAFDSRDHQFRLIFVVAGNSGGKISEEDITGIVESIQPVPLNER